MIFLLAVVAVLVPRLLSITNPPYDWHDWRQMDTAAQARGFLRHGMHFAYPEVDYVGPQGRVACELPLASYGIAWLWGYFGEHVAVARAWSVAMGLLALAGLWGIARHVTNEDCVGVFFTAWAFAWSPLLVFVQRSIQPDATLCALISLGGWAAVCALAKGGSLLWLIAGVLLGLGAGIKPTALTVAAGAGLALLGNVRNGRVALRAAISAALMLGIPALLIPAAWFAWALHLQAHGAATFGLHEKFSLVQMAELLGRWDFYSGWLVVVWRHGLGDSGLILLVLGLIPLWKEISSYRPLLLGWGGAFLVFAMLFPYWVISHIYYNAALVLCLVLVVGLGAAWLMRASRVPPAIRVALLALFLCLSPLQWWLHRQREEWYEPRGHFFFEGLALGREVPASALVAVLDEGYRIPHLLYSMDRRGFVDPNFPKARPREWFERVEMRRAQGATHLVYVIDGWGDNPYNVLLETAFGRWLVQRGAFVGARGSVCLFDLSLPGVSVPVDDSPLLRTPVIVEAETLWRETGRLVRDATAYNGWLVRTTRGRRPGGTLAAFHYGNRWLLPAGRYRWTFVFRGTYQATHLPYARVEVLRDSSGSLAQRDLWHGDFPDAERETEAHVVLETVCESGTYTPHVFDFGLAEFALDRILIQMVEHDRDG